MQRITLMGGERVCRYCYQGYIVTLLAGDGWPVGEEWALQNSADFDAHGCEGIIAERAAEKIAKALWRQEHAKKIRRRA